MIKKTFYNKLKNFGLSKDKIFLLSKPLGINNKIYPNFVKNNIIRDLNKKTIKILSGINLKMLLRNSLQLKFQIKSQKSLTFKYKLDAKNRKKKFKKNSTKK